IVVNSFNFIDQECSRRIWLVVNSFDIAAGIGGAAEEKAALPVTEFGFKPLPAGKSWSESEAIQGREKLVFDLALEVERYMMRERWKQYRVHRAAMGKRVEVLPVKLAQAAAVGNPAS